MANLKKSILFIVNLIELLEKGYELLILKFMYF